MTPPPLRRRPAAVRPVRAAAVTLAALGLLGAVAACSGSGGASGAGTTTKTVTATSGPSPTATPSATPTSAASDVKGRRFDAGTIVGVKHGGGLTILVLDRWTAKGLSDAKLAANGAPISPHSDARFVNENSHKTYRVPVNPSATIVINSCDDKSGKPPTMTSTPTTLKDFLARSGRSKTVVLLAYDSTGRLDRLDTDPAC